MRRGETGLPDNARILGGEVSLIASRKIEPRSINLLGFRVGLIEHSGMEIEIPPQPDHRISIALGSRPNVTTNISGSNVTETLADLCANIVPAEMETWVRDPAPGRFLFIRYHAECAAAWMDGKPQTFEPQPGTNRRDPEIRRIAESLLREVSADAPGTAMMIEGLALQLVAHVARAYHDPGGGRHRQGGLSPWQLRRVMSQLHEGLAEDLSLDTLARSVDLSRFHFARSFQHTTGLAPYQYLLKLRMEKAAALLADTKVPIDAVALKVGYRSAKTLRRPFKRHFRLTPEEFRRISSR